MDADLRELVRERAGNGCEYCRIHQDHDRFFALQIDHIIAEQHGGKTEPPNLALCCFRCNLHKGPNIAGLDPRTGKLVKLFHPRRHKWTRHFRWEGPYLRGRTPVGRATVVVLAFNHPNAVDLRESLIAEGACVSVFFVGRASVHQLMLRRQKRSHCERSLL
jgi:hypothetical protein